MLLAVNTSVRQKQATKLREDQTKITVENTGSPVLFLFIDYLQSVTCDMKLMQIDCNALKTNGVVNSGERCAIASMFPFEGGASVIRYVSLLLRYWCREVHAMCH